VNRPLLVIIRADHGNLKPSWDPGAHADIDADGVRETWEQEAHQVLGYAAQGWLALIRDHGAAALAAGVDASTIDHLRAAWLGSGLAVVRYGLGPVPADVRESDGTWPPGYKTAHVHINRWAETWAAETGGISIVLCCHCNAGGGTYGMVGADKRSGRGQGYQERMAQAFEALPELSKVTRTIFYDDRGEARPWLYRSLGVVGGAYSGPNGHAGLILEPGFLDAASHRALWSEAGHRRIGQAIARGCAAIAQAV
jgi:hypothetical protein